MDYCTVPSGRDLLPMLIVTGVGRSGQGQKSPPSRWDTHSSMAYPSAGEVSVQEISVIRVKGPWRPAESSGTMDPRPRGDQMSNVGDLGRRVNERRHQLGLSTEQVALKARMNPS